MWAAHSQITMNGNCRVEGVRETAKIIGGQNITKSEIYKAISDLIADSDGASIDYIVGVNDMGRYLAEQCKDAPAPELPKEEKKSTRKIDLDMGKVKALRDAGWTLKEIADEMHVAPSTISNKLKEEGEEE